MKTTIDAAGRLVIPKKLREEAGLRPGMPLDVRVRDGRIEIEPATIPVKLVRKRGLLVAMPTVDVEPMRTDVIQQTLDDLRRERGRVL